MELTIGEVAHRAGVNTSALRFYEKQGLIHSRRSGGNQRRYHRAVLRRVAFIRASQAAGISLDAIGGVLGRLGDEEAPPAEVWEEAARTWAADLDERIALLVRMRERLTSCVGCGCLSLKSCHLLNPDDRLAAEGGGARRLLHD